MAGSGGNDPNDQNDENDRDNDGHKRGLPGPAEPTQDRQTSEPGNRQSAIPNPQSEIPSP